MSLARSKVFKLAQRKQLIACATVSKELLIVMLGLLVLTHISESNFTRKLKSVVLRPLMYINSFPSQYFSDMGLLSPTCNLTIYPLCLNLLSNQPLPLQSKPRVRSSTKNHESFHRSSCVTTFPIPTSLCQLFSHRELMQPTPLLHQLSTPHSRPSQKTTTGYLSSKSGHLSSIIGVLGGPRTTHHISDTSL